MSMSSRSLEALIAEFPEEKEAINNLDNFIKEAESSPKELFFDIDRLFNKSHFSSFYVLVDIIQRLVDQGLIKKIIRIESDAGGGIKDFDSMLEIPPVINDWRTGLDYKVDLNKLHVLYKIKK